MKKNLFGQNIVPECAYCENFIFEKNVTYCSKGKQLKNGKCRSFKYDPLMRLPKANELKVTYTADDFKI